MKKSAAFLTLLSLSCLHFALYSRASGGYYHQNRAQVLTDSKFHTQQLKGVAEQCMKNDADRKERGMKIRVGHTILSDRRREEIIDLVEKGADPDIVFYYEDPHSKKRETWSLVEIAAAHNRSRFLRFLLEQGANPNRLPGNLSSPLERAVDAGSLRAARLLFEWGADQEGGLIFRLATHTYRLHKYIKKPGLTAAMAELLIRYGANVLSRNSCRQTPVEVAQERIYYENNNPKDNRSKKLLIASLVKAENAALHQQRAKITFLGG